MNLFAKLLALFKPRPAPIAPSAAYPDAEFLEAVAKLSRERYQERQPNQRTSGAPADARQVA